MTFEPTFNRDSNTHMEHDASDLMNPREQAGWEMDLVEAEIDLMSEEQFIESLEYGGTAITKDNVETCTRLTYQITKNKKYMETIYMIVGLIMIYSWVHTGYLMVTKMKKLTGYEIFVILLGVAGFALYVMGTVGK